jgi:two-component system OmpR family response regulator
VDDFHPVADKLVEMLATDFYDARAAYDAKEALTIAEDFRPHALIADAILPGMDGFRLAAEFAHQYPDCQILLMTAPCGTSSPCRTPRTERGLRLVRKDFAVEETFRLLEECRCNSGHASH